MHHNDDDLLLAQLADEKRVLDTLREATGLCVTRVARPTDERPLLQISLGATLDAPLYLAAFVWDGQHYVARQMSNLFDTKLLRKITRS